MAYKNNDDEFDLRIIESYGKFSSGAGNWIKEVNLVSWNKKPAKLDIRNWQKDHKKCGKGIAITREEAEELVKLLYKILKDKPSQSKAGVRGQAGGGRQNSSTGAKKQSKKKAVVPQSLEPYYDELELLFGAGPDECKSARNTLLKKYHPDKNAANTAFATRKTIKIKEAYDKIIAWWDGS